MRGGEGGDWRFAEPTIEDRVTTGGQHRHQVKQEEDKVVVGPAHKIYLNSQTLAEFRMWFSEVLPQSLPSG